MDDITTAYATSVAAARREEIRRVAAHPARRQPRRRLVRMHRRGA